jgi:hypothetical protein
MRLLHTLVTLSWFLFVASLATAYVSVGAGIAGLLNSRVAGLAAIMTITFALCCLVAYFVAANRELDKLDRAHKFK